MDFNEEKMCDRFGQIRNALGMRQAEFSKSLSISQGHVSDIENHRKNVSGRIIEILCLKFNVSEEWIKTGSGDMFAPLSRDEEIAAFVGKALSDETDTFKKRLIAALSQLDEPEWELLEKMVMKIAETEKDQA